LLNLSNCCFAFSFNEIQDKIQKKTICEITYNFSKTAAIVNADCGSAIYINFKTKKIQNIIKHWPNVFANWKTDNIIYLQGSCGTGCSQSVIFMAPFTKIVCPVHEYRIESLSQDEPPDFYNNDPLLIEPDKKIYVCYAEGDVIQVFQMPTKLRATIHPPRGYYADSAKMHGNLLAIVYINKNEKVRRKMYRI
jgi:hypothetical protein